jgi:outer membrane immunogenic protein
MATVRLESNAIVQGQIFSGSGMGLGMKRILLAGAALAFCGPALAADLSAMRLKAPIRAPAPFSWTGCYVGGHVGAGWGRKQFSDPGYDAGGGTINQNFAPPGQSIPFDVGTSFLGGAQVGCDYQFAPNWVFGAEGDFSWTDINGQTSDPFFLGKNNNPITLTSKTDELATATARLGYAFDHYLLYAKGGAAWAHDSYSLQNLATFGTGFCATAAAGIIPCNPTGSETRLGWTVGFGIEWAFAGNWSALAEFDHYDMGNRTISFFEPTAGGPPGNTSPVDVKQRIETVKFGINYHLGWAGR